MTATVRSRLSQVDRFWWWLAAIAVGALALRLWYALRVPSWSGGDEGFYHQQANLNADGKWFVQPFVYLFRGELLPSALHPPFWPLALSGASRLGLRSFEAHRVVACLISTGTVVVMGLTGRRVAGATAGIIAAALAAVYPNLWIGDGLLELTTLYALLISLVVLLTYRWIDAPSTWTLVALGVVIGVAALTRAEGIQLAVALVPVFLLQRKRSLRQRWIAAGTTALVALVVVAPWVAVNLGRYERPVFIATSGDVTIGAANCADAYSGKHGGAYSSRCWDDETAYDHLFADARGRLRERAPFTHEDESVATHRLRTAGIDYALDHIEDLPGVALQRLGRTWDFYQPRQNINAMAALHGRDVDISQVGQIAYYVVLLLAVGGFIVLRRTGRAVSPLVMLIALTCFTAVIAFGEIRLRIAGEVSLLLLAACFLASWLGPLDTPPRTPAADDATER